MQQRTWGVGVTHSDGCSGLHAYQLGNLANQQHRVSWPDDADAAFIAMRLEELAKQLRGYRPAREKSNG